LVHAQQGATFQSTSELVIVERGELPILISAPHGGREPIPGVDARRGESAKKFVAVRDENTAELAEELADEIAVRLKKRPYVVIAKFERKFADANRAPNDAYEASEAGPHYLAYHAALERACREINNKWHAGLLLDIHGQGSFPDSVLRGTNNGETVKLLIARRGNEALVGPSSLFGRLASAGFDVNPKVDSSDREAEGFSGGYIVRHYGSHEPGGIDAVQLEFGRKFRVPKDEAERTAAELAAIVVAYCEDYLPAALGRK
jgi:N-formylglutamate amidohydrolase